MSEPIYQPQSDAANGQQENNTANDPSGTAGSPSGNPTGEAANANNNDAVSQSVTAASPVEPEAQKLAPGEPIGKGAPSIAELQNQTCPNCHTGVLYLTNYDPNSLYEQMQGSALPTGRESGGAYSVRCAHCDYSESRAFNPGPDWQA